MNTDDLVKEVQAKLEKGELTQLERKLFLALLKSQREANCLRQEVV